MKKHKRKRKHSVAANRKVVKGCVFAASLLFTLLVLIAGYLICMFVTLMQHFPEGFMGQSY